MGLFGKKGKDKKGTGAGELTLDEKLEAQGLNNEAIVNALNEGLGAESELRFKQSADGKIILGKPYEEGGAGLDAKVVRELQAAMVKKGERLVTARAEGMDVRNAGDIVFSKDVLESVFDSQATLTTSLQAALIQKLQTYGQRLAEAMQTQRMQGQGANAGAARSLRHANNPLYGAIPRAGHTAHAKPDEVAELKARGLLGGAGAAVPDATPPVKQPDLLVMDFDETILAIHAHACCRDSWEGIAAIAGFNGDAPATQRAAYEVIKGAFGGNPFRDKEGTAAAIRGQLEAGKEFAIASHGNYPHVILAALEDLGLKENELAQVTVICGGREKIAGRQEFATYSMNGLGHGADKPPMPDKTVADITCGAQKTTHIVSAQAFIQAKGRAVITHENTMLLDDDANNVREFQGNRGQAIDVGKPAHGSAAIDGMTMALQTIRQMQQGQQRAGRQ